MSLTTSFSHTLGNGKSNSGSKRITSNEAVGPAEVDREEDPEEEAEVVPEPDAAAVSTAEAVVEASPSFLPMIGPESPRTGLQATNGEPIRTKVDRPRNSGRIPPRLARDRDYMLPGRQR